MADWLMIFVLSGIPFAGGPYTREDCLELAAHHRAIFAGSNARCVLKDYPYRRLMPKVGDRG